MEAGDATLKRPSCPGCGEPWLRPTQLPGRYRCVYCLRRYELVSQCPNCGEHQTIARMSTNEDLRPALRQLDAPTRLTMRPLIAASIADQVHDAGGAIDVHLMIDRPAEHVSEFAKAGADCITAHFEADPHIHRTLGAIHDAGCLAGVAINPGTPATAVGELDGHADLVLCMSVNPGWGGQSFIASSPGKVRRLREVVPTPAIEIDGGIDADTVGSVAEAGATLFVAGSAVFGDSEPGRAFQRIAAAAGPA